VDYVKLSWGVGIRGWSMMLCDYIAGRRAHDWSHETCSRNLVEYSRMIIQLLQSSLLFSFAFFFYSLFISISFLFLFHLGLGFNVMSWSQLSQSHGHDGI